jgi:hypothetical protein
MQPIQDISPLIGKRVIIRQEDKRLEGVLLHFEPAAGRMAFLWIENQIMIINGHSFSTIEPDVYHECFNDALTEREIEDLFMVAII